MTTRTELLEWLNELLQINYSKVEQCGAGGAYCQVMDSIYGDVPMNRVKMNAKQEYEYLANYKILQNVFKAHKVDKPVPVERLVKCKMQDNLEFLQWLKRFWDANYGGAVYNAVARRSGVGVDTPATIAPLTRPVGGTKLAAGTPNRSGGRTPLGGRASANSGVSHEVVANLRAQIQELTASTEGLEKERDFYFAKLRDIEILVTQQLEVLQAEDKDDEVLREIQKILYSTEEGFEAPNPDEQDQLVEDDEETF